MRELTFINVSEDGTSLLLGSTDGATFSVPLDDRLLTAVRRDRAGQRPPTVLEGTSPRDIQNRIRHGQTPQDIEATTDLDLERIMRFAGPVLAERSHVASQAQQISLKDTAHERTLSAIVLESLEQGGADLESVEWDAWRRDETHWSILVCWEPVDEVADGATASGEAILSSVEAIRSTQPGNRTLRSARVLLPPIQIGTGAGCGSWVTPRAA